MPAPTPAAEAFVLDTSFFTNPDVYRQFGRESPEALARFLELAGRTPARFYMPGSVYAELQKLEDLGELAADFEAVVRIRSPRKFNLMIPSQFLYEFIEEVRARIDRGLRIAEEHAKLAGTQRGDVGGLIKQLRGRYRDALRQGILDSREDMDVLLLAYELDAILVSGDQGLCRWADKVGIKIVNPRHVKAILESLIDHGSAAE